MPLSVCVHATGGLIHVFFSFLLGCFVACVGMLLTWEVPSVVNGIWSLCCCGENIHTTTTPLTLHQLPPSNPFTVWHAAIVRKEELPIPAHSLFEEGGALERESLEGCNIFTVVQIRTTCYVLPWHCMTSLYRFL